MNTNYCVEEKCNVIKEKFWEIDLFMFAYNKRMHKNGTSVNLICFH